jgi:hypothetical protein
MKEFKNIDELFKEGLKNLEVHPSPSVWEEIEETISPPSVNTPFFTGGIKWISAIIISLLIGTAIYLLNHEQDKENNLTADRHKNTNINKTGTKPSPIKSSSVNRVKTITLNKTESESDITKTNNYEKETQTNITEENTNHSNNLKSNINIETSVYDVKNTNSKEDDFSNNKTVINKTQESFSNNSVSENNLKNEPVEITSTVHSTIKYKIKRRRNGELEINNNTGYLINNNVSNHIFRKDDSEAAGEKKEVNDIKVLRIKSKELNNIPKNNTALYPEDQIVLHNLSNTSSFKNNFKQYFGLSVDAGMICYAANDKQFTWAVSGILGINHKKFYFETGIGYRFMEQSGSYKIDYLSLDSIGYFNKVTSFDINPNDPENIILHYKEVTVFDSIQHTVYNSPDFDYRYLTIPLKIGYSVWNHKKMFMAIETGIDYNLLMKTVTAQPGLDIPGDITNIVNETQKRTKNTWIFNVSARAGYRIKNKMVIYIQPGYSKYVNSIYDVKSGYNNVKPCIINLKGGILFDF